MFYNIKIIIYKCYYINLAKFLRFSQFNGKFKGF